MSSSVFIETCAQPVKGASGAESEPAISGYPDSNLVVVYGKSGVNFDRRGIENLIEEKTLSSISVIRLTSPTPSMIDEEQEAEKREELLRRQAEGISDDDSNDSSTKNSSSADECAERTESEELPTTDDEKSDDCGNSVDNGKLENRKQKRKNRRKSRISAKVHNKQTKLNKERPDIVGLTIEEFYPPVTAKEVVKEALKLAGVPTFKHTAEYEFQLFVIKNDHCYTPFTSPTQMKAKLAEKYKAEKHAMMGRKIIPIPHNAITMKQIQLKKKVLQNINDIVEPSTVQLANKNVEISRKPDIDEPLEDDADAHSSPAESEIDIVSEESGDTDNDRDSDLDFDVNNRKGRKKKDLVTKAKRLSAGKVYVKRQLQNQDELDDPRSKNIRPVQSTISNRSNKVGGLTTKIAGGAPIAVQKLLSDAVAALPPIPKRSAASLLEDKPINNVVRQQTIPTNVRRGPIIEVGMQKTPSARTQLQSSPQSVKEIAINKMMASPKGGFTEISELLNQAEKKTPTKAFPTTPTSSLKSALHAAVSPSPSKGFMPLGIETAARNKLPAQISIQTHQSSSELAAKSKVCVELQNMEPLNDISSSNREAQLPQKEEISSELAEEHFDLIVSIVKDEMQKTDLMKVTSKPNDNIPKLVKMLQNAEHTLESNNAQPQTEKDLSDFGSNADSTVDDIDISNAPLLDSNETDEIPEDLLQHVVDLIGDDETLQEVVQNQVFGGENNEAVLRARSTDEVRLMPSSAATTSMPPAAVKMQPTQSEVIQPKSIIEMAISNITSTPIRDNNCADNVPIRGTSVLTTRSPVVRKEPIQIIRGNGRVITLPPIEAPTTRAKRRAQNQPMVPGALSTSNTILVDSSLDSSLQSNSSFNVLDPVNPLVENKKEQSNKRRVSKESATAGSTTKAKRSSAKKSNAAKNNANKSVIEEEAVGSQEDDDDPNKLWCICRQPHNNRFMICCDVCEDWFHGTCVNITKAMGIEMEQKGIDWTCPKCIKLQEEKTQRKITDMLMPKNSTSNTSFDGNEKRVFEMRDDTSAASNIEAISGSIVDSSTNRSYMQKTDKLDAKQNIETNKTQSDHLMLIKPPLKKASGTGKAGSGLQKKKQSANAKSKNSNVSISQSKRRIPISEQSTAMTRVSGSQQTIKNLQKPPGSESIPAEEYTLCIVCKKIARQNSIYCSDDCIRKHAQNALNVFAAASAAKLPEPPIVVSVNEEMSAKKKKSKGLFEDLLSMADRKPKVERVNVIERKTGRVLTGSNAPTTLNLKKWLQDNQTFEVVQPGSFQALEIEKRQRQRQPQSLSPVVISSATKLTPQTTQNTTSTVQSVNVTPVTKATMQPQKEHESSPQLQKPVKQLVEQIMRPASKSPRPGTPKHLQKYPQHVSIKPDKADRTDSKEEPKDKKEKSSKQRSSLESVAKRNPESVTPTNTSSEPIRLNVRRTLKEQLLQRMNEPDSENKNENNLAKLSVEEVDKFSLETEAEMYEYFSRDTGSRYRAKYRSLMFNIKDRKNHTLFAKICAKEIQPKQLVRMSPEELASQELAKWRENETKHQLEMIKKSELDLLSCTKNYVLKTHKGEEVIEGKSEDCVNLDVTIPVEDVVSVLNSAVVSSSSTIEDKVKGDVEPNALSFDYSQNIENNEIQSTKITNRSDEIKLKINPKEKDREPEGESEKVRNRDRDREHSHIRARSPESDRSREKQKKNRDKDRHRDKSRSRKRSRSHSRSRSRSREKRHKSHHRDEKREKEERDREKDRHKDKDRDARSLKDELDKKVAEKSANDNSNFGFNPNKSNNTNINIKDKTILKKSTTTKPVESFSLIDQILESTKTVEEAANLISDKEKLRDRERDKEKQKQNSGRQVITPPLSSSAVIKYTSEPNFSNDDQEPTSTVSIATPPQDPYMRYADAYSPNLGENISSMAIWSGNINMVDVASFQIVLQPVVGNSVNIGSLLPGELDVVGRIGPDTVWEYISKIKRSPNKEIVIIRLIPASESETAAYTVLFQYLENRNRLGVISTASPQIKDFYIYPLGAGKSMPAVLQPTEKVDFYEDPFRPDILVGVLVRIVGKRHSTTVPSTTPSMQKSYRRGTDTDTFTPPGSPKRKRRIHTSTPKVEEIDLDAIIKAPITIKAIKTAPAVPLTTNDADEPYSPGGSSDDDSLLIPKRTGRSDEDELKRKMDELNRQIAAQEKEIAGLLNVESSCFATTSSSKTSAVLANISIPSNLSQILASIKNKPENSTIQVQGHQSVAVDEEYNPEMALCATSGAKGKVSSRLAQLSEAELLSMVPDGMMESPPIQKTTEIKSRFEEPPPPGV